MSEHARTRLFDFIRVEDDYDMGNVLNYTLKDDFFISLSFSREDIHLLDFLFKMTMWENIREGDVIKLCSQHVGKFKRITFLDGFDKFMTRVKMLGVVQ